jgi:hypothetical protein
MPTQKNGIFFFTPEEIEGFKRLNFLIDGSRGGMLVGNYHSNGGIPVLKKCDDAEMYEVSSVFEGWEYLLCPIAMENHIEYLTQINLEFNGAIDGFEDYEFSDEILRINTFFEYESIMLKVSF